MKNDSHTKVEVTMRLVNKSARQVHDEVRSFMAATGEVVSVTVKRRNRDRGQNVETHDAFGSGERDACGDFDG